MKGYDIGNNAAVIRLATLHITGNVVSLGWFNHIKMPNGKPDTVAIMLYADIVYWYRPIEVRDETTGILTGYRKKFAADKLQRSYGAFAEQYGYTKDQVKDALKRLEDNKLIDLDFRHPVVNGQKLGNVLYIGLNVERLVEINTPLPTLKVIGSEDETPHPPAFKDDTNTETTTETTPEITTDKDMAFFENAPADWKLAHGLEVTQDEMDDLKKANEAPRMFEQAFGFNSLPWGSNRAWEKFQKFVTDLYKADRMAFGKYTIWRKGDGKYKAMSNKQIRLNPQVFMDTGWPEFSSGNAPVENSADHRKYISGEYADFLEQ
jgi:uncharacterized protein YjbJ (UPF0337 family)